MAATEAVTAVPPQGGYVDHQCPVRAWKDNHPDLKDLDRTEPSPMALERMESGNRFETAIGEQLAELFADGDEPTVFLPNDRVVDGARLVEDKQAREAATMDAIGRGVWLIWNARVPADMGTSRISEPDALLRVGRNRAGNWAYAPIDVKDHATVTPGRAHSFMVSSLDRLDVGAGELADVGGMVRQDDSRQLAHYHRHLQTLGFAQDGPVIWGGVIGREQAVVWRDLNEPLFSYQKKSALGLYDDAFAVRLRVIAAARCREPHPEAIPVLKTECSNCPWQEHCREELEAQDHVSLLAGVTEADAVTYRELGVTSRVELAQLSLSAGTLAGVDVPWETVFAQLHHSSPHSSVEACLPSRFAGRAKLLRALRDANIDTVEQLQAVNRQLLLNAADTRPRKLAAHIDVARTHFDGGVWLKRGVAAPRIPRADVELHVDMENDVVGDQIVYLWGTWLEDRTGGSLGGLTAGYTPFYTFEPGDVAGEGAVFAEFWAYMTGLAARCETEGFTFAAYCYTGAEETKFRLLADRHYGSVAGVPSADDIDRVCASDWWCDLYQIVSRSFVWPLPSLSLKAVAPYTGFEWRDAEASGENSIVWYQTATIDPDPALRTAAQQRLLIYNEDDVKATVAVLDWLDTQRFHSVAEIDSVWE